MTQDIDLNQLKFSEGLGRGSSGDVYLAAHKETGHEYAVRMQVTSTRKTPNTLSVFVAKPKPFATLHRHREPLRSR